jgi:hypothetical protein
VDLKFQNVRRLLKDRKFCLSLSKICCRKADFLAWIEQNSCDQPKERFDFAFLCRLLNNFSDFSIGRIDDWREIRRFSSRELSYQDWREGQYLPQHCLAGNIGVPRCLFASNRRIRLHGGTSFGQLSLSDYYRGLSLLNEPGDSNADSRKAIFYPVRRFNDASLILPGGESLLEKLCEMSELCVIEDVDLDASGLRCHLDSLKLNSLAASEATNRARMKSASLLCVCRREWANLLPGKRIW